MQHENLLQRLHELQAELLRILDEALPGIDPTVDPRFIALLDEAIRGQKELDVLMRGTFHDRPDELAAWEKKMGRFRDTGPEEFLKALRSETE